MDLTNNIIFTIDSYKDTQPQMMNPETEYSYSYQSARIGAQYDYSIFFGSQYIQKKWLEGEVVTRQKIDDAEPVLREHFKFNGEVWDRSRWDYIVDHCGGKLPIQVNSVPEGSKVNKDDVQLTIENTDKHCAWLPGSLETVYQQVWMPTTVATRSNYILNIIRKYFRETVDDENQWLADFYLHDFGQRAATCMEHAGIAGMAHLLNSKGTDTKMGIAYAMKYYGASFEDLAYSVPASEHRIATSEGEEGEFNVVKKLIKLFPKGILSHVSDSYDIENAILQYCTTLKSEIMGREGKFVARPDSPRFEGDTPAEQILWITKMFDKYYGSTVNSKGYKDLDPHISCLYGDSLDEFSIEESLETLKKNGYSALASVFGCGGYLIQKLNRDTQRQAFKCSAEYRNGEWIDIYKKPKDLSKASKKGRFDYLGLPVTFRNGEIIKNHSFSEIRDRLTFPF